MCGLSRFFPHCLMVFGRNHGLICLPEVGIARTTPIDVWNGPPELSAGDFTAITDGERDNLARFPTECQPYPVLVDFLANKGPNLIQFEDNRAWIEWNGWNERVC